MRPNVILFSLAGIVLGFAMGFLLANSINRSQMNGLRTELESARSTVADNIGGPDRETLSNEEVRAKIAEADQNPDNAEYQKNLGLALYRYGALKNDVDVMTEAARLLERAAKLLPDDKNVSVGLGNAWFDIGYVKKDNGSFQKARAIYEKELSKSASDADLRTDLGMTYFLEDPPDNDKAVTEFKRALTADPKNEKALEFIVQSLSRQGNNSDAAKYLDTLKQAHPSNQAISTLTAQLAKPNESPPK